MASSRPKRPKAPPPRLDLEEMEHDPSMRGMLSFLEITPVEKLEMLRRRAEVDATSVIPFPSPTEPADNKGSLLPAATVLARLAPTVGADTADTAPLVLTDTVAVDSIVTVSALTPTTVSIESADTAGNVSPALPDVPKTTVSLKPGDTVAIERSSLTATTAHEPTETVTGASADTVSAVIPPTVTVERAGLGAFWYTEGKEGVFPASRVRPIALAQDALTHAEESVYDVLWGPKNQNRDSQRSVSMGYDVIARTARVTKMNAKWIVERLIYKGFLKVETLPDPLRRIPTKYCVFSYRAALDNMVRSNRFHVIRTGNGVLFAHPLNLSTTVAAAQPATVVTGSQTTPTPGPTATNPAGQPITVAPSSSTTVSVATTHLGNTSEAQKPSTVVAAALIREFGLLDDDAIQTLIRKCREQAPDATDEEIAELGVLAAGRIRRNRNIDNPIGLLISQTPKYFTGEAFAIYRREKTAQTQRLEQLLDHDQN